MLKERLNGLISENEKLHKENKRWEKSATALLQSEQRLLALVNKVPIGIFATAASGDFLFVNETWSRITGISPEDAVGSGWSKALHPKDQKEVVNSWYAAAGEKVEFSLECRLRASSAKPLWVYCRMQATIGEHDAIEGYLGTIIDISERKRYEEEIGKLNAELEERVRQRTRQLSVVSEDNLKKLKEISLLYRLSNTMLSTIKLNKLIHLILTALTSGENPFFDRAMLFLLNERARVMQGMLGVTREPLREGLGSVAVSGDALAGRWDLTEEEMATQRDSDFSCRVRGSRLKLDRRENVSSRSVFGKRLIFVRDVSRERGVDRRLISDFGITSFAVTPLMAKEKVVGVVIVDNALSGRNITDEDLRLFQLFINQAGMAIENSMLYNRLEDANRSLREAQDQLIQGERLATIGEMAAGIAHELKNPLVSIGGFARRLEKKIAPGCQERDYAATIVNEVKRLEKMLSEILDFSKKSVLCYEHCNIIDIVEDALTIVAPLLEECRIKVARRYSSKVPSFLGDGLKLKQVFLNLFYNSQEAMKNGGQLNISVSTTTLGGKRAVSVKVADSGGGIPQEGSHNIFNPFYTTKKTGTGLGLPIANRIVANHGGKIVVHNQLGVGVEFNVIIPLIN
jgi:PAS domain S-box-containing protein